MLTGCVSEPVKQEEVATTKEDVVTTVETTALETVVSEISDIKIVSGSEYELYESLFPIYYDGAFEYIDIKGNIVTDEKFETANFFYGGFASVSKNGKYGAINLSSEIKIPLSYDFLGDFNCGLAVAKNHDGKLGYINSHNELVIPYNYDRAQEFNENMATVTENDYDIFVIDINGEKMFDIETHYFGLVGNFNNGLQRQGYSYYNSNGDCVIPDKFYRMDMWGFFPGDFSENVAVYPVINDSEWYIDTNNTDYYMNKNNWKYRYIDTSGEFAFDKSYDYAEEFRENLAVAEQDGKRGIIDKNGEFVFYNDNVYGHYSEELIVYYEDEDDTFKYGFLDTKGNVAISAKYDTVLKEFTDGLALVQSNNTLMYIDHDGKVICSFDKPSYEFWKY